jgi:tetratricopeptide (TPR) repeat protein
MTNERLAGSVADDLALGLKYHAMGNLDQAQHYYQLILKEDPNHAEALRLIGLIARARRDPRQALVHLNKSLTANGANPLTWQNVGEILLNGGDPRGAITYFEQALRLQPDLVECHNALGLAWKQVKEWDRAIECFREATRRAPNYAMSYNNLGMALRAKGRWAEAIEALMRSMTLAPDKPDFAFNLGNTHRLRGELDLAVACYKRAISYRPKYVADVSNWLGVTLKEQGRLDEAVAQFQETLLFHPDNALALCHLAELGTDRFRFPSEDIARMREVIAAGKGSPSERKLYRFTLGKVLDREGSYDEAFQYFQGSTEPKKRLSKDAGAVFSAGAHRASIDKIMGLYDGAYFKRVKDWGTDSELPVFIVGMPHSGGALVQHTLASHPQVFAPGPAGDFARFSLAVQPASADGKVDATVPLPDREAACRLGAAYLAHLAELGKGASRVVGLYLDTYLHQGAIATLFPRARIIYCRRNALDACLSCYFDNFLEAAFTSSLEDIAAYHRNHQALMVHWSKTLPAKMHEVSYERLINDPASVRRELFAFLGLGEAGAGASIPNFERPIGFSKNYARLVGALEKALE